MTERDDAARQLAKVIHELIYPRPTAPLMGSTKGDAAAAVLARFEDRARELEGASAPTGLDAIQAKYDPSESGTTPDEAGLRNLRRVIGAQLGLQ
jgi:hypothetical protein